MPTIGEIKQEAFDSLIELYDEREAASITSILLTETLGMSKEDVVNMSKQEADKERYGLIKERLHRLMENEPIQYIIGQVSFMNVELKVDAAVLIPRPETEELVNWIVKDGITPESVLDIGTGSGCIALALKDAFVDAEVSAWDVSKAALDVAQGNARINVLDVRFEQKDILSSNADGKKYDLIVSNPPYVLDADACLLADNVVQYEPSEALFIPDDDPLVFYRAIADFSFGSLKKNGRLFFEIDEKMGNAVLELLCSSGFNKVELRQDLSGKDRMVRATLQ